MSFESVREAHGFAQSGGVIGAVKSYLAQNNLNTVKVANLDKKNIGLLRLYAKTAKAPAPFVEVMACEGGCVTGPCIYTDKATSQRQIVTELNKITKDFGN